MRAFVLVVALVAHSSLAQVSLGNMFQLGGTTTAMRPDAGLFPRVMVFDLDGGAPIYSNGTTWLPFAPLSYTSLPMVPTSTSTVPASGSNIEVYNQPDAGTVPGQISNVDAVLGFTIPTNAIPVGNSDVVPCRYVIPNGFETIGTTLNGLTATLGGSQQTRSWASTNLFTRSPNFQFSTGGGANTGFTGYRAVGQHVWRGSAAGQGGFLFWTRVNIDSTVNTQRTFFGLKNSTAQIPPGADPNNVTNTVYFGSNSADSNLSICANDNVSTATCADLGASFPSKVQGAAYDMMLWAQPNGSSVGYFISRIDSQFVSTYGSISSDLPQNSVALGYDIYMANGLTASIGRLWFAGVVVCGNL